MVDAEGAEVDILQPALSPALAGMNIIVETHDLYRAGALATMIERFAPTHDIVRVDQAAEDLRHAALAAGPAAPRPAAGGLGMARAARRPGW